MENNQKLDEKQIVARFKEAVLTIRKLPPVRVQGYCNAWPDIVYTRAEIRQMERKTKFLPATSEAISRMEKVLEWLLLIEEIDDKKLIWMRAEGIPWEEIAKTFGFSRVTASKKYKNALGKITQKYS
jgi:predicted DNA-binding protein (UPF0251 family)